MLNETDVANMLNKFAKPQNVNKCAVFDKSNKRISKAYRSIYFDNAEHKFFEYIDFKNSESKRAIAIGINPSLIESQSMDFTNKELVSYISQRYGGYILLNLYSKRTNSTYSLQTYISSMIGSQDKLNDCSKFISDILTNPNCNEDILIFWGQKFLKNIGIKNTNLKTALSIHSSSCYYSAGSKQAFVHPSEKTHKKNSRLHSFDSLINNKAYW